MKITLNGLYEKSYMKGKCRSVTLTTDVASKVTDNFIMTLTYEAKIQKDFEIGWCVSVEDMVASIGEKYPYTLGRKDAYIDWKTTRLKTLIKQTK